MITGRRRFALALGGFAAFWIGALTLGAAQIGATTESSALALLGTSVLLTLAVALLLWPRPQDRRTAVLLLVLAAAYAMRGLTASDVAWVYTLARAAGQLPEVVLITVVLAFPSGRLRRTSDRIIVACAAVTATVLWVSTLLFSETVLLPGPLVPCRRSCPENLLFISDQPAVAQALEMTFRSMTVVLLAAVAVSLLRRLAVASPLVRRTLAPLLLVSTLRVLAIAVFVASGGSWLSGVSLVVAFWAIPLAMTLGLLLARLYASAALFRLVAGLERRPDAEELRSVMADALDDADLEVRYWLPDAHSWSDAEGRSSGGAGTLPAGRRLLVVEGDSGPLAGIVHDEALLEQPALLEAVTSSARIALESNRAAADLAASESRLAGAESKARHDLERDLHDGAQQRLIALRMKVSVLRRLLDVDVRRAAELASELGSDIEATLEEIRGVARGGGPPLLSASGLPAALADLAAKAAVPSTVLVDGVGRYPSALESAVYFICSEAMQNSAKHGGPSVQVAISLRDDGTDLTFEIRDDGLGGDPGARAEGRGLFNMRDRLAALGGELTVITATPGISVRGSVPVPRLVAPA